MKRIAVLLLMVGLSACGYSSRENELIGQFKKVVKQTPIICPERTDVDVSLGVVRNGVGSMSTQDMWLTVEDESLAKKVQELAASGAPVKITYDERRLVFCQHGHVLRTAEIQK